MRPETVTVLRTLGPLACKRWLKNGKILGYDHAKQFLVTLREVSDIRSLAALVTELERDPRSMIIRGTPKAGVDLSQPIFRRKCNFDDIPRSWLLLDSDKLECPSRIDHLSVEAIHYLISELPKEFHRSTCFYQFSGSAGHPSKSRTIRAHLLFWSSEPKTCAEFKRYFSPHKGLLDLSLYSVVQPHFIAKPVLDSGMTDPVGIRSGLIEGGSIEHQ